MVKQKNVRLNEGLKNPVPIGTVTTGDIVWRIFACDFTGPSADKEGLTLFGEAAIFIERSLPRKLAERVLLHELIHVVLWSSGAWQLLPPKTEEVICDALGCELLSWLKFKVKFQWTN